MTIQVYGKEEQWIPAFDKRTNRPLYVAVPSQSTPNRWHLVSSAGCSCIGFSYRQTCRHHQAVQAWLSERRYTLTEAGKRYLRTGELERRTEERVPLAGRISA